MNKNIAKPLIIQFTPPETNPALKKSPKSYFVPVNTPWNTFKNNVLPLVASDDYDSVLVHVTNEVDRDAKGMVGNMSIKMNALSGAGTRVNKPVLSYESTDKPFYLANPSQDDMKAASIYAPADATIMEKFRSFVPEGEKDDAWQEHQSKIWNRMKDMMPLSRKSDQWNRDHAAQLKDPKRGLEEKDLGKFWSFKSRQGLAPTIMGDDMVGMPSVEGKEYDGFTMTNTQSDGSVKTKPIEVRSLMTTGTSGIAIPMANANGHVNKHQIASDLTPFQTALHFRAEDGRTVAKGELFNKKTREYSFKFADGTDTHLKVTEVAKDDTITMQDAHGIFNVKPKKEIIDILKDRGYDVPGIITSVKTEQNGKYMWQSPGTMTGSDEVLRTVSPSNPGFIIAREPKNEESQYVVLIAEGALKGHIVAKYADVKDKDGVCFGDKIAGDKGIIVTQVPGVAEAYVKNAITIYEKYDVKGTYIAMDADGRENRNVAMGIHSAYKYINAVNPATVLSWNPEQKGMDDALLAVAQGKITIEEMGIVHGTPDQLFPLDKTEVMTPYKLDGTRANRPAWMMEYTEDKKAREEKIAAAQAATAERAGQPKAEAVVEQPKPEETTWVETPNDISNIQNATVTKAADMADAKAGNLPPAKAEAKAAPTPDVDEKAVEKAEKAGELDVKTISEIERAKSWDASHPAMPPIPVPEGYKAEYVYQQPILHDGGVPELPTDSEFGGHPLGKWGPVNITVNHELSAQEVEERQKHLSDQGATCIGSMRLTSQTFMLDNNMDLKLDAADLPATNDDGIKK